jgi:hypothetical protein
MVTGQKVVRIVVETGVHGGSLGKFWGPDSHVGTLGLMDSLVWGPDSIMDDSLTVIPFLEVITSMLLMSGVNSRKVLHEGDHFGLLETLVHQKIVFLMHSSVASLARSAEDLETSSQSLRVESVPGDVMRPVSVTVVQADGVNLFFITLNSVGCADVISEDPSLALAVAIKHRIGHTSSK